MKKIMELFFGKSADNRQTSPTPSSVTSNQQPSKTNHRVLWLGGVDFGVLSRCNVGDKLKLCPSPTKDFPCGVSVHTASGDLLGYLSGRHPQIQKKVFDKLNSGIDIPAEIREIKHSADFDGCSIWVIKSDYM